MKLNKKGQIALWEIALVCALGLGFYIWTDSHKQTESNKFEDQSKQTNIVDRHYALLNISLLNGKGSPDTTVATPIVVPHTTPQAPIIVEPVAPTLEETFGVTKEYTASIGHLSFWERVGLDLVVILIVMIVGGLLDALGGYHWLFCRRYLMPFLLAIGVSTLTYAFNPVWYSWFVGLLVTPSMGTLCLGYPSGDNFGRALWLFIQAVVMGIFLVAVSCFFHVHLLAWWLYLPYVVMAGIWGGIYRSWQQFAGDFITGSLGLCSLIFYVYLTLQFKL